jgi:hypothetical protein
MKNKDYLSEKICWEEALNPEFPLKATHNGKKLRLRMNDFPAEPLYTLLVNDEEILDLDDLPANWKPIKQAVGRRAEAVSVDY